MSIILSLNETGLPYTVLYWALSLTFEIETDFVQYERCTKSGVLDGGGHKPLSWRGKIKLPVHLKSLSNVIQT